MKRFHFTISSPPPIDDINNSLSGSNVDTMTLPVEVFQVRKPLYVAPLTIRDDQNRPNFNLPSTYEPPCFRNEEEQKVLGVDFATSLKQIHSQWVTNRTRSHPETKQNAEKNYVFTSWLIKWGLLSTKYKGDPFSAGRYNLWPDEMMKPYYPELHECSDSPQWDLIQEMSWDSDQIKEVISIYKKHPKEFLTRLHEAYPIPTFSTTKELVIEKINKFIEEFVRHANDPQPVVDGDNSDSNSWWITKKFNKYVYPYYEWFLGPDKNNLKNIEERTPIENQVTEWMNSELFNNLEQKDKWSTILFIYRVCIIFTQELQQNIPEPQRIIKTNKRYEIITTIAQVALRDVSVILNSLPEDAFSWYNTVQGRFQLQLIELAYTSRKSNPRFKRHFEIFSDYIFGTCH